VATESPTLEALHAVVERLPHISVRAVTFLDAPTYADQFDLLLAFPRDRCPNAMLTWLSDWRQRFPTCPVIVVDDGGGVAAFEPLLAAGASDFITLPFDDHELQARVRRALGLLPTVCAPRPLPPDTRLRDLVGNNVVFLREVAKIPIFAGCDASVLITGDTGTGKEVFAQAVHYISSRASRPWVAVNCGAIPNELVESELFGHLRGAFTNAYGARQGLVREAEGGTLFLDDIDSLPLTAQAKLLRFLQEREFRQVGSNNVQHANVRVIAASNRKLTELVARGEFRQDLYFRLNVLTLELPPLRERREDVPMLALHFLRMFNHQFDRHAAGIAPAGLNKLMAHDWPGNVRELKHVIERAVVLVRGAAIGAEDIDFGTPEVSRSEGDSFRAAKARVVESFERGLIEHLLAAAGGNVTHAAQAAGKNRRAFFELMRKYRIEPERFRRGPPAS
jgi:two-component system response regulator GlrR